MTLQSYLQLTLAILKPDVVKSPFVLKEIRKLIIDNDFKIVRTRRTIIGDDEAQEFYKEHKNKFYFNRLLTFICSGPSDIYILTSRNAITKWRNLLGPTKVYQAQYSAPNSIRGKFGLSDTKNAVHGSDSVESANREIAILFKDFNIKKWYENDEVYFQSKKLIFDPHLFIHLIDKDLDMPKNYGVLN
ncbi:PREDICTED: nucleoside diphosphate kinase 6-like [Ceratosolen solmsi marchali]|uniref:Nucleoside diphosphate kinase n=1 Tax=Ceratosolen solmsi marchali TaxID=326594 RepID=A0AAJ7E340_9HYME|nr:PREDICTED: nucleoside diphosphate kinase 6-like [Ceratosolen solmsi marchali]